MAGSTGSIGSGLPMTHRAAAVVLSLLAVPFLVSCAAMEPRDVREPPGNQADVSRTVAENPDRFLKRTVAVARFSNETSHGQGFFRDREGDPLGKKALDILSAKLAQTNKFILLERSDMEQIRRELQKGNHEQDLSALDVSADYLIVGSISQFGRKTTSEAGPFSRTRTQTAHAGVNIRLIDVYTGQIIFSEDAEATASSEASTVLGAGGRAGYDATLDDKAIDAAISKLTSDIVENLLDRPWRSYILAREGERYLIAGGPAQGLRKGDVFGVFEKGKRVRNPQTGMMVELPGKQVAEIRVDHFAETPSGSDIAFCSLTDGELPSEDYSDLYVQELEDHDYS